MIDEFYTVSVSDAADDAARLKHAFESDFDRAARRMADLIDAEILKTLLSTPKRTSSMLYTAELRTLELPEPPRPHYEHILGMRCWVTPPEVPPCAAVTPEGYPCPTR